LIFISSDSSIIKSDKQHGPYILLALISYLFFNWKTIISGSTGPIFTIFSPNDRYLRECERSRALFQIPQGALTLQPILSQNLRICVHSAEQRLKTACNIAILIQKYSMVIY